MEKLTEELKVQAVNPMIYSSPDKSVCVSPQYHRKIRNFFPSAFCYIVVYLDLGYKLCFIPFRFKFNRDKEQYEIIEFLPQKIVTVVVHIFISSYYAISYLRRVLEYHFSDDPLRFFRVSESLIGFFYPFVFTQMMILKKSSFEVFLKLAQEHHLCERISSKKYSMQFGVCILYILFGLLSDVLLWAPAIYNTSNLHLSQNSTNSLFLIFGSSLLSVWRGIGDGTCILLFGFGWYLRQICEDLGTVIISKESSWAEVLKQYLHMKKINSIINSITKYMILEYIVGSIPFISQGMIDFSLSEPNNILSVCSTGTCFLITMLGSAEANSKANQLKQALLQRQLLNFEKDTDLVSLQMLLSEFSSPDIGLKGMHFFTVTYSLVGVMLSQCLVYALIILQLKGSPSPT